LEAKIIMIYFVRAFKSSVIEGKEAVFVTGGALYSFKDDAVITLEVRWKKSIEE